jgi:H+/Cl- antiporter ClcA
MTRRQALAATLAVLGILPVILVAFVVAAYAEIYGGSFAALAPAGALVGLMLAVGWSPVHISQDCRCEW